MGAWREGVMNRYTPNVLPDGVSGTRERTGPRPLTGGHGEVSVQSIMNKVAAEMYAADPNTARGDIIARVQNECKTGFANKRHVITCLQVYRSAHGMTDPNYRTPPDPNSKRARAEAILDAEYAKSKTPDRQKLISRLKTELQISPQAAATTLQRYKTAKGMVAK